MNYSILLFKSSPIKLMQIVITQLGVEAIIQLIAKSIE